MTNYTIERNGKTKTFPVYLVHFYNDKNGRPRASYYSNQSSRWVVCTIEFARTKIAKGHAVEIDYSA